MKKTIVIAFVTLLVVNVNAQNSQPNVVAKPKVNNQQQTKPKGKHSGVSLEQRVQHKVELMQSQLGLNEEQTKKLTIAMTNRNKSLKALRDKVGSNEDLFKTEATVIRKRFQSDIKLILTAEQFAKLKEIRKANKRVDPNLKPTKENDGDDLIDETEPDLQKKN